MFRYSNTRLSQKYGLRMEGTSPFVPAGAFTYPYNATNGVAAGGYTGAAWTDKFELTTYSTETTATNAARLTAALWVFNQTITNGEKTLQCGGFPQSGASSTAIKVYTHSTNTAATSLSTLINNRRNCGGGVGITIGYVGCGLVGGAASKATEKITIATEAVVAGPDASVTPNSDPRCVGGGDNNNYYLMGHTTTSKIIDKISFAANTLSTLVGETVQVKRSSIVRINHLGTLLYIVGGNGAKYCEKMTIATETSAAIADLGTVTGDGHPASSTTRLYTIGGYDSSWSKVAQYIAYATDTGGYITGMNAIDCGTAAGGA